MAGFIGIRDRNYVIVLKIAPAIGFQT
jgi:hypothetical protein